MDYWKIAAPILICILIYVVFGSISVDLGITIYDDFSTTNVTFSKYTPRHVILRNNAPLTLPFVNPPFMVSVNIIDSTGQINCLVDSEKGGIPCETALIDLGYIPVGQDKSIKVTIIPNGNNFTIQLNARIDHLVYTHTKSKSLGCINQGNNFYFCK